MKQRLIMIVLLVLSSGPVYAEWVLLGKADSGITIYFDPDTIRRQGDLVKMWSLSNYKTKQIERMGKSYYSSAERYEFDCAKEQLRILELTDFSDKMGRGAVVAFGIDPTKWKSVLPSSAGQARWKAACAKK